MARLETSQRINGAGPACILVVEDERVVAMSLEAKLEAMGYNVVALASTGEGAIREARTQRPDLVLMDIRLQGDMDGVEAAQVIRAELHIPVVYLTAYSTRDIVERAKVTEPYGYILKPVTDRELHVVVEVALYRHRAQQEIVSQRRLLHATLHSIGDAVVATDREEQVTFMNPVAERLLDCTLSEARGTPLQGILHAVNELTREPVVLPLLQPLPRQAGVPGGDRIALARPGASAIPIEYSAAPILDEFGQAHGAVLVFQDVTEKRSRLCTLAALAAIVESSQDAVIGFAADRAITSWNPAAERLTGYTAAEVLGRSIGLLAPPELQEESADALRRLLAGEAVAPYETAHLRKDGSTFRASVALSAVRDELGRTDRYAAVLRDVTELRHLEEQFRQAQKVEALGILAGSLAHDFNNLLTVISGYSRLLLEDPLSVKQKLMIEEIWEAGKRGANLTAQLLAFTRKQIPQPTVVDLNDIILHARQLLQRLIGEDIDIKLVLADGLNRVRADPGQLEQVLMNLAINARDAMPTGGQLTIATSNVELSAADGPPGPGQYAQLLVADTGCGMSAELSSRIFEPFFTTKEPRRGTGLGLAMVHGCIQQSQGHITVSSTPGQGTVFKILLPRTELRPTPAPGDAELFCPSAPPGATLLLAEDDEVVRRYAAQFLRIQGYQVLEAADGKNALQLAAEQQGPIHLLVTDVIMPKLGGRLLVDQLRQVRPNLKVLYMSGHLDDALLRHGFGKNTDELLQKPFNHIDLARAIYRLLTQSP